MQYAAGVLDLARRVERGQIVGAMLISSGGCSNGFTPGPAATITASLALSGEVSPFADLLHGRTEGDLGDRDGVHEPPNRLGILVAGLRTVHGTMSGVASMARRG